MARSEFILQGLTATTHDRVLRQLFDVSDIQRILVSVAFVTEAGVRMIEGPLIQQGRRATVFAGVGNGSTSYQGLARLNSIVSELYVVDTRSPSITFHPKLYLVHGMSRARLIIGSANLTLGGLSGNIEAGVLLDLDLADAADRSLLDSIETPFDASVTDYPDYIIKIYRLTDLDEMLAEHRLVDERKLRSMGGPSGHVEVKELVVGSDGIPPIKLKADTSHTSVEKVPIKKNPETTSQTDRPSPKEEANSPNVICNEIEAARKSSVTHYVKWRPGEGRRERARRAKDEAKALGKKWYYTGDPCRYRHDSDRLVSNGKCRECNRLDSEKANRLGLYR